MATSSAPRVAARWCVATLEMCACLALACGLSRLLPRGGSLSESMFRSDGADHYTETPRWVILAVFELAILFPIARRVIGKWELADFGLARPFETLGECSSIAVLRVVVASVGVLFIPGIAEAVWTPYAIRTHADLLVYLLWISPIVAGLCEELLFRCYVQGTWMGVDVAWGAVATAVCFALLHGFQGLLPLFAMHLPTGLLVVGVYARRRDLPSQVVGHALFDVVIFAELWLVHERAVATGLLAACLFVSCGVALVGLRRHVRSTFSATWDLFRALPADFRHAPFAALAGAVLLAAYRFFAWR